LSLLNRICDNDSHFTYFIACVNGLYRWFVRALWITKPFILISQMKVQVFRSVMKYCTMFISPLIVFYCFVIEDTFRAVINMKNLQRKTCRRNFGLNIFKTAPLFFLKFGHIYSLLLCFIKINSFYCFQYSVCSLSSL
jgi:hypothetical protein